MKILFFIESFGAGGKERRLFELIHYLKHNTDFELSLVLMENKVHYDEIHELEVPITIIRRKGLKRDPRLFREFWKFCQGYKPDVVHTWGFMPTFYAVPVKIGLKIPLISSMITVARREFSLFSMNNLFFKISSTFSDTIVANSRAGLEAFNVKSRKARVIYNGVRLERFRQDFSRQKIIDSLNIKTPYIVIMVATFSRFKDYDLFLEIAKETARSRNDITFLAVGDGPCWSHIEERVVSERIENVILTGRRRDVESLVFAADIGILCTFSEGISNSIIEYMALSKPTIATDLSGGSKELIVEGQTGFCTEKNATKVAEKINYLIDNPGLRHSMGENGEARIRNFFSIDRMGMEFVNLYNEFK